jgi:hypothetical protein
VTGEQFIALGEPTRVFHLTGLANVTIVRAVAPRHLALRIVQLGLLVIAGVVFAVLDTTAGTLATVAVLAGLAVVLQLAGRQISWELHARYRDAQVTLFSCEAVAEFNQVCRALRRSMEIRR